MLAEELGFDSVVVSDHFHPWRHDGGHSPVLVRLAGAPWASAPSRIALGTSVVAPAYRYHPAIVAQAMATLGVLYPAGVPRRGHGRGAERGPARRGVAGAEGALPDAQGGLHS